MKVAAVCVVLLCLGGVAQQALASPRVSVQPFDGESGSSLREQIIRIVRARGFSAVTSIGRVSGTGQYLSLARDHRLVAFVTGDMEEHRSRHSITFLVWDGASGSVLGRWTATATPKQLRRTVARGFWKRLGPALGGAVAPPSNDFEPAAPMWINAGSSDGDAPMRVGRR